MQTLCYENGKYVMEGVKAIGHTGKSSPSGGGGPVNNNLPQLDTSTVNALMRSLEAEIPTKYGVSLKTWVQCGLPLDALIELSKSVESKDIATIFNLYQSMASYTNGEYNALILEFIKDAVSKGYYSTTYSTYGTWTNIGENNEYGQRVFQKEKWLDYTEELRENSKKKTFYAQLEEFDRINREMMEYFNRCLEEDKNRAEETSQSQRNEELRRKSMHDELQMYLETFMQYGVQYEIDRSVDLYSFGSVDEYLEKALKLLN